MQMKTTDFIGQLRAHKNPNKSKAMEQYMRNQFPFLGLQATKRRQLAQPFLKERVREAKEKAQVMQEHDSVADWSMLFMLWDQPEREFQLIGVDYLKKIQALLVPADLEPLRRLVLTKSWWDTVDFLAKSIGAIVHKDPSLKDEMVRWSEEENLWIRRVSILHQLALKADSDTALLTQVILNNQADKDFFIQKAIGWALREYAKTDTEWVRAFVRTHQNELSRLSVREATKNLDRPND